MTTNRISAAACLLACLFTAALADEPVREIHETFENFDATKFTPPIPNKYTEVRNGALWTRGFTGSPYPPMVYMPVEGKDLHVSFRFRQLDDAKMGWLWFFVDGEDGHGSVDHLLRVKLLRDQILLEVDGHSLDPDHPLRQKNRDIDAVSKTYRLNEFLPSQKFDLSTSDWHTLELEFRGESVSISLDGGKWKDSLKREGFKEAKKKLLFMQKGDEAGIEIDDIHVTAAKP